MFKNIFILLFSYLILISTPVNAQIVENNNNLESYEMIGLTIKVLSLDQIKYEKIMNENNLPEIDNYYYSSDNNFNLKNSIKEYNKSIIISLETIMKTNENFDFSFMTSSINNISNEFSINAEPEYIFDKKIVFKNFNLSSFNSNNIFLNKIKKDTYNYNIYIKTMTFKFNKDNFFILRKDKDNYLIVSIKPYIDYYK